MPNIAGMTGRLACMVVACGLMGACSGPAKSPEISAVVPSEPEEVLRGRAELAELPQSPDRATRMARADDALAQAFQPYAAGGRVLIANAPIAAPVQVAALPRPVAPGAVVVASASGMRDGVNAKRPVSKLASRKVRTQVADLPIRRAVDKVLVKKLAEAKVRRKLT